LVCNDQTGWLGRETEYLLSESEMESPRWLGPDLVDIGVDAADADER
jgi:hypothetical protein